MAPPRDSHQRLAYAMRRASLAVDRLIRATQPDDAEKATRWAKAWGVLVRIEIAQPTKTP